ncbi:MAG: thioredoxin [Pirellulales bacterium]|nr:thioredoxin [Pirellulales bacterium]
MYHRGRADPPPHAPGEQAANGLTPVRASDFESAVLQADVPVLVDFYADWCGPCRQMEPILAAFAKENPGVKVVQVNVDENGELADRYHIQSIPHFMVFKKGKMTAQQLGGMEKAELKALIDR